MAVQAASSAAEMEVLRTTRLGLPAVQNIAARLAEMEAAAEEADQAAERCGNLCVTQRKPKCGSMNI